MHHTWISEVLCYFVFCSFCVDFRTYFFLVKIQSTYLPLAVMQGPAQAQNLRDSLVEAKSNIVVKVGYFHIF